MMTNLHLITLRLSITCCGLFFLGSSTSFAQTLQIDALKEELKKNIPDTTRLTLLKKIATAYTSVDVKQRFYYAGLGKNLAEKLHDDHSAADALLSMGTSYAIRGLLDSSIFYFTMAYNRAEKIKYDIVMGKSLTNTGYANDKLDNTEEAIKCYLEALKIFKRIKYLPGINQCYTNIGSIYFDHGQHALAKTYFEECLKTYTAAKDEKGVAYSFYNLGNCYQALKKDKMALTYLNKSLAIRKKLQDVNGIGLIQRAKGLAYLHLKKYDDATSNLDSALTTMKTLQDRYQEAAVMLALVDVYNSKGDYEKAEYYGLAGLRACREIESKTGAALMLEGLVKVYKNKNEIGKAFKYQSEYVSIQDSLREEKLLKDITLTEFKRIRTENTNLADSNRVVILKNTGYLTKLRQYNNILVIIIASLVFVVFAVVVLYQRNQEKLEANQRLRRQQEEVAKINKELELLNEEINAQMELTNNQNIELAKLNSIKNKFFSIISHDLRSPLNTLKTLFSIYREGDIKEDELRMLLGRLEDTILTTSAFLDNLLEWSKSQLEGIVVRSEDFDIRTTINDNLSLFKTKIEFKDLIVVNNISEPVFIHADPNMIKLVIRNLLSNSIKFCKAGDQIEITGTVKQGRAIISITDTGPGISEVDVDNLFSLEHAVSTTDQGEKGNKLGLILCRDTIEQNKGNLTFETKPGNGTTFRIDLPAGKA